MGAESSSAGAVRLIGLALAYVVQIGAFFAVLRLGLEERESTGPALGFGLLAGLIATLTTGVLFVIAAMAASQFGPPGIALFVILATLVPVILALATWSTLLSAFVGVGFALTLVISMTFGATTGNLGFAATWLGGGSGLVVVLLLVFSVGLVWLAARLSCTAAVMADRRSANLFAAMRASWSLTAAEQGRLTLYLGLVGLALVVLTVACVAAVGGGAAAIQDAIDPTVAGVGGALFLVLFIGVPMAFLSVLIPAGIYLELAGERAPVEVFA